MKQRIKLSQGSYHGAHEKFELIRVSDDRPWTVRHQYSEYFLPPGGNWVDVSDLFDPGWLNRAIIELQILGLKTEDEINLPCAEVLDGLEFVIEISLGEC